MPHIHKYYAAGGILKAMVLQVAGHINVGLRCCGGAYKVRARAPAHRNPLYRFRQVGRSVLYGLAT